MLVKTCLGCGQIFSTIYKKKKFCTFKCYKSKYNEALKEGRLNLPEVICSKCGKKTKLDFVPKMNKNRWREWACPHCGNKDEERNE